MLQMVGREHSICGAVIVSLFWNKVADWSDAVTIATDELQRKQERQQQQ